MEVDGAFDVVPDARGGRFCLFGFAADGTVVEVDDPDVCVGFPTRGNRSFVGHGITPNVGAATGKAEGWGSAALVWGAQ